MSSSEEEDIEQLLCRTLLHRRHRRKRVARRFWVRPIFSQRALQGAYHHLVQELRLSDPGYHFRYFRMSKESFDYLHSLVHSRIERRGYNSRQRPGISTGERLAVTLRFLATGDSQSSLSFHYRFGRSTLCTILREVCAAIWEVLQEDFVKALNSASEWRGVAEGFQSMWDFPNCVGAIDGKHITIQAPARSGSMYYNYKGTHSIVLLAVCDAYYRFLLVDIGNTGRHSDGGVLSHSDFGRALYANALPFPNDQALPGTTTPSLPHVFVGDEAFPLRTNLLRPSPGRDLEERKSVFNYRLSRARRTIENTFGILAARLRIFRRPIIAEPDHVVIFTKAAIALHNFLRVKESSAYCPAGFTDSENADRNVVRGAWRDDIQGSCGGMANIGTGG